MKLSARSRYAARILLELAQHKGSAPLSAATLSQRTGVSVQFVEQILKPLKQAGITASVRGAAGGHRLSKATNRVSLGDIVRLMEGGICLTVCCGKTHAHCQRQDSCLTRKAWERVSEALERELNAITLDVLLADGDVCLAKKSAPKAKKTDLAATEAALANEKNVYSTVVVPPKRVTVRSRVKGLRR